MNKLTKEQRKQIILALVEGNSLRSISRMVDISINTVTKLLIDLGCVCAAYQEKVMVNLPCKKIQCDEVWSFCYSKEKNVPDEFKGQFGYGDVWTWSAICADTKLVPCWFIGSRDADAGFIFMKDLDTSR